MRVIIPINNQYAEDFIQWLVKRLKSNILLQLDLRKLYPFIAYQKDKKVFKSYNADEPPINFESVIKHVVKSITYKKVKDNWIIYIPENTPYKGYFTTLYALCRFIDKGNSEVQGYSIFSNNFNGVAANVSKYYNQFLKMFVL